MSLYHEAAEILTLAADKGGSLKSIVFGKKKWKSDAKTIFALTTEAAKWSDVLSEVIERSGVLKVEKNLTPTLALLLVHDLFLSKKGIALPATHGLHAAASRHKARLSAELTKARLRLGFPTLEALREHVNAQAANGPATSDGEATARHPRWIRINTLRTTLASELATTFGEYAAVPTLREIIYAPVGSRLYHIDIHVPHLLAITAGPDDPTTFRSYRSGNLILQEKASCFPAYLLDPSPAEGEIMDACAAPGNKTTHLAALLGAGGGARVVACERDAERSETLRRMVRLAGADGVVALRARQDFTRLDPRAPEFAHVTALLLDPSCSGSGIFGRDEARVVARLPGPTTPTPAAGPTGRKRKRRGGGGGGGGGGGHRPPPATRPPPTPAPEEEEEIEEEIAEGTPAAAAAADPLSARLRNLAAFQLRIVQHAMSFPAARRIAYSTCSVHARENEGVVVRAVRSAVARRRGWRVLRREEQVAGLRRWQLRGSEEAVREAMGGVGEGEGEGLDVKAIAEGCIRCEKGGEGGTMGFFVVGFVRDGEPDQAVLEVGRGRVEYHTDGVEEGEEDEEWNGFSDGES